MINQAIATILAEAVQKNDDVNYQIVFSNTTRELIISNLISECIAEDKNNIPREVIELTIKTLLNI